MRVAASAHVVASSTTVRDRTTSARRGDTLAKSEPVREEFAWKIADAIVPHTAAANPTEINRANDIARQSRRDRRVPAGLRRRHVPALYDQLVNGDRADVVLDPVS